MKRLRITRRDPAHLSGKKSSQRAGSGLTAVRHGNRGISPQRTLTMTEAKGAPLSTRRGLRKFEIKGIRVAELARAGLTPDWRPGAAPRCVTVEMECSKHGDRADSVVVGTERAFITGIWRSVEVRACLVTSKPDPLQSKAARQAYDQWWSALGCIRDGLTAGDMMRKIEATSVMLKASHGTRSDS